MSEQRTNYMSELDGWTTDQVIRPLNEFWKTKGGDALDVTGYHAPRASYGRPFEKRCWKATTTARTPVLEASSG